MFDAQRSPVAVLLGNAEKNTTQTREPPGARTHGQTVRREKRAILTQLPPKVRGKLPVEIAAGGLTVFGKRFELPIAGPGLVRVLYHDSTMRIFESPLTSQDKWEESGLVVVQVRESAVINS